MDMGVALPVWNPVRGTMYVQYLEKKTLCLYTVPVPALQFKRYSAISPYKILYSYVALVPAPSCIWQYKFVRQFAGTLDTAFKMPPSPHATYCIKYVPHVNAFGI